MNFWKMAFNENWVTAEELKGAVKTKSRLNGEITKEEYREITGIEYKD